MNNNVLSIGDDSETGLFSIRGSLDGEQGDEFSEREQFIGLTIHKETFFLPLSDVSEIVMLEPIRFVPGSPKYIEGVLNLRGTILPAVNLCKLMGLPRSKVTPSTRTIIVNNNDAKVGLLVDGLSTVIGLLASEIEEKSLGSQSKASEIISKIAKHDENIIGILDTEKIINIAADRKIKSSEPEAE